MQTDSVSQEAREAAAFLFWGEDALQCRIGDLDHTQAVQAFARFEALIRADAYEQAAKVAEEHYANHPASTARAVNYRHAGRIIATAIRTLSEQPVETRQDQGDGEEG